MTTAHYTTKEGLDQQQLALKRNVAQGHTPRRPHLFRNHNPDFGKDWWTDEQARRRKGGGK